MSPPAGTDNVAAYVRDDASAIVTMTIAPTDVDTQLRILITGADPFVSSCMEKRPAGDA
jgi:hypothetical protein